MNRGAVLGFVILLAAPTTAMAQGSLERGRYLVDTVMTCHNCHTPKGPNGPQFDKALSGGLRFDEPPFDATASNITPDRDTGIGNWSDAEIKTALQEGKRPAGHQLAEVMPSGFYKILTPSDLDSIVIYLRSLPPVNSKVPGPVYKMQVPHQVFPGAENAMAEVDLDDKMKRGFYLVTIAHCMECIRRSGLLERALILKTRSARAAASSRDRGAFRRRATSHRARRRESAIGAMPTSSVRSPKACARTAPSSSRRWVIPFMPR
jgi:mono/diheme cytochrome c family protein